MGNLTLIIGESGTGKSTSIRTLNPTETFVINVLNKPLPFKGYKNLYKSFSKESLSGNYYASDDTQQIIRIIKYIDTKMPQIKNIIIDDFQYIMANMFMRRAKEKGYDKFTEIGQKTWEVIEAADITRADLSVFFLSHSDTDSFGKVRCKTIGKMIDNTITLEGMFTLVLHSSVEDGKYKFLTQNDGQRIAKSPMGMFEDKIIDNDLQYIVNKMNAYYSEEIQDEFIPA